MLMMTRNHPPRIFLWLTLLLLKPAPENVPLVKTCAAGTLFEGHTWGWDGIDFRDVVSQNQNEPSFKNVWIPQILHYIDIFLH